MLTTKTMMMNWMERKKLYCCCRRCGLFAHFYAHKYQHYCENSMEISDWNKSMIHTTHMPLCIQCTLLYTLHMLTHTHPNIAYHKNNMRKAISHKCNVCHVIDFYNVDCKCISRTSTTTMAKKKKKQQGWKFQFELNPSAA